MLDDDEWGSVATAQSAALQAIKDFRERNGTPLSEIPGEVTDRFYAPMRQLYGRITGLHETDPKVISHHRVSLYGPPCSSCGKPLRPPQAKLCAACGHRLPSPETQTSGR